MDELRALLDRVYAQVVSLELPVAGLLRPGLSEAEIAERVKALPFKLPREVYALYQWRDGMPTNRFDTALFPGPLAGWVFNALDDALVRYQEQIAIAQDVAGADGDWRAIWDPLWFPVFDSDVPQSLCVLGQEHERATAPILLVDVESGGVYEKYTSLTHLMRVVVECYERGGFRLSADGMLEVDEALVGMVQRRHAHEQAEAALATLRGDTEGPALGEALNEVIRFHDERAIEPLLARLRQSNYGDPSVVAALAALGDQRAVEPLLRVVGEGAAMASTLPGFAAQLALALQYMNRAASLRSGARKAAIDGLDVLARRLYLTLPVEPFVAALHDPFPYVRARAALMLGGMGNVRALEGLVAATRDPDVGVRCRVAEALGTMGDTRAVAALTALLGDASPYVRRCATVALKTLRG
jgi:hypothetical protein